MKQLKSCEVTLVIRESKGDSVHTNGRFVVNPRRKLSFGIRFDESMSPTVILPVSMSFYLKKPQALVDRYSVFFTDVYEKSRRKFRLASEKRNKTEQLINDFIMEHCPSDAWLRKLARETIEEMVDLCVYYHRVMGLKKELNSVAVKLMKSRWGSCSSDGALSFNCLSALLPQSCRRYLVIHELCHLFEMNHSSRFWALVARFCPDYKKSRILMRAGYAHLFVIMDELRKRNFITYGFGSKILASTKDNVLCMSPECNEKWKRRAE